MGCPEFWDTLMLILQPNCKAGCYDLCFRTYNK